MSKTIDVALKPAQYEVFSSQKRFRVLVAGRRFGKSYLACIELLQKAAASPGETFFYCAPTYRMAKDIAWKVLKRSSHLCWCVVRMKPTSKSSLSTAQPSNSKAPKTPWPSVAAASLV